jgi:replication-associated recombination protein RarA
VPTASGPTAVSRRKGKPMTVATRMFDTCSEDLGRADKEALRARIEAGFECDQACTARSLG